jgi:hypothetical protein
MSNDLTTHDNDDGFGGSVNAGRFRGSNYIKWTKETGWRDRDGLTPPSPMLVLAIDEALQRWRNNKPEYIRDKPLPDKEQLNAAIPQEEWERTVDGKPRPPYTHIVVVLLVDLNTGVIYKYESPTYGARIAFDNLREAVITMRALRGERVMPLVNLAERPMKTQFGMGRRPHFEIITYKSQGGDTKAMPPKPTPPQLSAPAVAAETPPLAMAAPAAAAPATGAAQQRNPKPPVNLASDTLAAMADVTPVTMGEVMDDEVPW